MDERDLRYVPLSLFRLNRSARDHGNDVKLTICRYCPKPSYIPWVENRATINMWNMIYMSYQILIELLYLLISSYDNNSYIEKRG